jgi:hypothetical protein
MFETNETLVLCVQGVRETRLDYGTFMGHMRQDLPTGSLSQWGHKENLKSEKEIVK